MKTVFIGVSQLLGFLPGPATSWSGLYHTTDGPRYHEKSSNKLKLPFVSLRENKRGDATENYQENRMTISPSTRIRELVLSKLAGRKIDVVGFVDELLNL